MRQIEVANHEQSAGHKLKAKVAAQWHLDMASTTITTIL
jgi:hypothetical protein